MSNALQTISNKLSTRFNMGDNSTEIVNILRQTAFKGSVSESQLVALMIVADQYGLNPFTREIYAYPDKNNGIVPVVGVDGWSRIINEHPMFDGIDFIQNDELCTCIMHRKDRSHPISVTEWFSECYRPPIKKDGYEIKTPWQSHPKRMLRHKALIQCARLAFGFVGIYDQDEAERIIEAEPVEMEVRPGKKAETPKLDKKTEAKLQSLITLLEADDINYVKEYNELTEDEQNLFNKCFTSTQKEKSKKIMFRSYMNSVITYINEVDNEEQLTNYVLTLPKLVQDRLEAQINERFNEIKGV